MARDSSAAADDGDDVKIECQFSHRLIWFAHFRNYMGKRENVHVATTTIITTTDVDDVDDDNDTTARTDNDNDGAVVFATATINTLHCTWLIHNIFSISYENFLSHYVIVVYC